MLKANPTKAALLCCNFLPKFIKLILRIAEGSLNVQCRIFVP